MTTLQIEEKLDFCNALHFLLYLRQAIKKFRILQLQQFSLYRVSIPLISTWNTIFSRYMIKCISSNENAIIFQRHAAIKGSLYLKAQHMVISGQGIRCATSLNILIFFSYILGNFIVLLFS